MDHQTTLKLGANRFENRYKYQLLQRIREYVVAGLGNMEMVKTFRDTYPDMVRDRSDASLKSKISTIRKRMGMQLRRPRRNHAKKYGDSQESIVAPNPSKIETVKIVPFKTESNQDSIRDVLLKSLFQAVEGGNTSLAKKLVSILKEV